MKHETTPHLAPGRTRPAVSALPASPTAPGASRPRARRPRAAGRLLGRVAMSLVLCLPLLLARAPAQAAGTALVLYDDQGDWGWIGRMYSQHMANLLTHFDLEVERKPASAYTAGEIDGHQALFYLGAVYDATLPQALLDDVLATAKPVAWLGYNLDKLAWGTRQAAFEAKTGFRFLSLDTAVGSCPEVRRGAATFSRESVDGTYVGLVSILDPAKALAGATCQGGPAEPPYLIHGGNFTYVADMPFSYVSETDRYLAFADALHDILGVSPRGEHPAILRIEDVHPMVEPARLRAIADALAARNVPFVVSVIPVYENPLGIGNHQIPQRVTWSDVPETLAALRYMTEKGGQILEHGYTHQYASLRNPYNGISGDDWEFFRVRKKSDGGLNFVGPLPEDSADFARGRVLAGKRVLHELGLHPVAWLTPHYLASETDYAEFAKVLGSSLDRGVYFATDKKGKLHFQEQIAPYVIPRDIHGGRRIPETCAHVNPDASPPVTPRTLIDRARLLVNVRDGWAGMYFHWYLDVALLEELVDGVTALGFRYASLPVHLDLMWSDPADGGQDRPIHQDIALTFTEPLDPATVTSETVFLDGGRAADLAVSGDTVTLSPREPLPLSTTVTVTATTGLRALHTGRAPERDLTASFATASPLVAASPPPPGLTTQTHLTLTITGTGLTFYRHRLDGGDWSADTPLATPLELFGLSDGAHVLELVGGDEAGYVQAAPTVHAFTVDATAPEAPGIPPEDNPGRRTSSRPAFSWRASPGATAYVLEVSATADFASPLLSRTVASAGYVPTPEEALPAFGRWHWRVRAVDEAGNLGDWSAASFVYAPPAATPALGLLLP